MNAMAHVLEDHAYRLFEIRSRIWGHGKAKREMKEVIDDLYRLAIACKEDAALAEGK